MTKKEKIEIHRNDEMAVFDDELDAALSNLEGANRNVVDLLESIESDNAVPDTESADAPQEPAQAKEDAVQPKAEDTP